MKSPGITLQVSAPNSVVSPMIISSLRNKRYRLKSAPGILPAKLRWGSNALSFVTDVTVEILPVALIPSVWHKTSLATVRIFEVPPGRGGTHAHALRIDITPDSGTTFFKLKRFTADVEDAISELRAQNIAVTISEITDTVQAHAAALQSGCVTPEQGAMAICQCHA